MGWDKGRIIVRFCVYVCIHRFVKSFFSLANGDGAVAFSEKDAGLIFGCRARSLVRLATDAEECSAVAFELTRFSFLVGAETLRTGLPLERLQYTFSL